MERDRSFQRAVIPNGDRHAITGWRTPAQEDIPSASASTRGDGLLSLASLAACKQQPTRAFSTHARTPRRLTPARTASNVGSSELPPEVATTVARSRRCRLVRKTLRGYGYKRGSAPLRARAGSSAPWHMPRHHGEAADIGHISVGAGRLAGITRAQSSRASLARGPEGRMCKEITRPA